MKTLALLLLLTLGLASIAEAQNVEKPKDFNKVRNGMTELNVMDIVGNPFRIEPYFAVNDKTRDTSTFWVYENMYTIAFVNHKVDYVMEDRAKFVLKSQQWFKPGNRDGLRIVYYKK